MKPEAMAEILIWEWIRTNSKFNKEIYFNRINAVNSPVFKTRGSQNKPDFVIKIDKGYGEEYIAAEVKPSKKSRSVFDGSKILDYYKDYICGDTTYIIDEKEVSINHFALITDTCVNGSLFLKDKEVVEIDNIDFVKWGMLPRYELRRTKDFIRNLWAVFKKDRDGIVFLDSRKPSLGVVISNINEKGEATREPLLITMMWKSWGMKKKWGQRCLRL